MMKNMSPEEYIKYASRYTLVDVRSDEEWDAYHEEGSMHIPLTEIDACLPSIPKEKPVVVICRTGGRSARGCEILSGCGFEVYNLLGGIRMLVMSRARSGQITSAHAQEILSRL